MGKLIIRQGGSVMPLLQVKRHFQITLPSKLRRVLDLKEGDLMEAELVDDQAIILRPKVVVDKGRSFSSQQIADWIEEDKLDKATQAKAKKRIR